jgi:hypothetical protein
MVLISHGSGCLSKLSAVPPCCVSMGAFTCHGDSVYGAAMEVDQQQSYSWLKMQGKKASMLDCCYDGGWIMSCGDFLQNVLRNARRRESCWCR